MSEHKTRLSEFHHIASQFGRVVLVGPMASTLPPASLLSTSAVLAVDGGCNAGPLASFHYIVGDRDSYLSPQGVFDQTYSSHKDQSDLDLALECIPPQVKEIHLWGFWGGRLDHQLMNHGAVFSYLMKNQAKVQIHSTGVELVWGFNAGTHSLSHHGTFSLFSLRACEFSIAGACAFPLPAPTEVTPLSTHTLSNRASGDIQLTATQPFFVYLLSESEP